MKKFGIISMIISLIVMVTVVQAGDNNFYDEFKKYAEDEIKEQAEPIVEAFGISASGGLYHTAKTHGVLGFDIGVRTMMAFIPEGESMILDSADVTFFPLPVIQASVGLPMDFEVMVRGFGIKFEDETISLFGAGVKKNFKHLIPVPQFPDLSAMIAFHKFKAGDVLHSSHFSFDLMVSKKFLIITPYAGFGIDKTSMDLEYTYEDPTLGDIPIETNIKTTTSRLTLGVNLQPIPFVSIFADYNIAKYSEVTAGIAIGLR